MPEHFEEDQLVHYFAGECTEEEAAEIEAWIRADPERKERVAQLRRLWEAAQAPSRERRRDADAMWDDLTRRLRSAEPPAGQTGERSKTGRDSRRPSRRARGDRWREARRTLAALAASVAVAVAAVWAFYDGSLMDQDGAERRAITTEIGERARVRLEDGTMVTLNAESKLTIPPKFADGRRTVNLQGEAYFEVESDEKRPFWVRAGGSVATVLGTKFNVGAYPSNDTVRVVVAEGKVNVRSTREESSESVTLTERQMASLEKSGSSVLRQTIDPTPYLAWTEGRLVFRNAPFEEVARRLRHWYGLRVRLDGPPSAVDRLNTTFADEPVSEVLHIIAETLDLRYERTGDTVTFFEQE